MGLTAQIQHYQSEEEGYKHTYDWSQKNEKHDFQDNRTLNGTKSISSNGGSRKPADKCMG